MRLAIAALVAVAALLLGTIYFVVIAPSGSDRFAACRTTRIAGGAEALGGPFSLIDETGARVTQTDVITKPTLLYFGYSYCPDVCPIDGVRNSEVVDLVAANGIDLGHVFVTVDPERDTPDVLAEFTSYFDDEMLGLTGSPEDIAKAAKAYRAYYAYNDDGKEDGADYLVDHSAFTYLVGDDARVVEVFRRTQSAQEMASAVSCFAARM